MVQGSSFKRAILHILMRCPPLGTDPSKRGVKSGLKSTILGWSTSSDHGQSHDLDISRSQDLTSRGHDFWDLDVMTHDGQKTCGKNMKTRDAKVLKTFLRPLDMFCTVLHCCFCHVLGPCFVTLKSVILVTFLDPLKSLFLRVLRIYPGRVYIPMEYTPTGL